MEFLVCLFQFWIRYMCIDLCRRDRSMSEKFLYDTDICTICQKSRSKTMSECMSVDIFKYSGFESIGLYHIGYEKPR